MAKRHYENEPTVQDVKAFAKYLADDEELILATGFGKTYLRQKFLLQIFLPGAGLILLGLGLGYFWWQDALLGLGIGLLAAILFSLLKTLWIYHANRYLLTTRRVIVKQGIISVKLTSALYDKITHIELDQGFVDRFFLRHGTIKIHTAGAERNELILRYVEHPIEFKNILERWINQERIHYGRRAQILEPVEGEYLEE